jgi:hypothetical protein
MSDWIFFISHKVIKLIYFLFNLYFKVWQTMLLTLEKRKWYRYCKGKEGDQGKIKLSVVKKRPHGCHNLLCVSKKMQGGWKLEWLQKESLKLIFNFSRSCWFKDAICRENWIDKVNSINHFFVESFKVIWNLHMHFLSFSHCPFKIPRLIPLKCAAQVIMSSNTITILLAILFFTGSTIWIVVITHFFYW